MNYLLCIFIPLILFGCNQQNRELNTKIINDSLCIFTNEAKNYGNDSFLVEAVKANHSKEYQDEYNKSYKNFKFPIDEKSCIAIPLDKIEKNAVNIIVLSTINKTFRSRICVLEDDSSISIKQVEAGKFTCD